MRNDFKESEKQTNQLQICCPCLMHCLAVEKVLPTSRHMLNCLNSIAIQKVLPTFQRVLEFP